MNNKVSFKRRILIYFSVIIAAFTVGIVIFEQNQIKKERTSSLERTLENNADIIYNLIQKNNISPQNAEEVINEQLSYMPSELRLTIINWNGKVVFDNLLESDKMDNHIKRPEIQKTIGFGSGSNIRVSKSNNIEYLYFAKEYKEGYFIRMALPYDVNIRTFINSENSFVFYILLFFVVCVLLMLYFTNRFTKSIRELKEFSLSLKNGVPIPDSFKFADNEVGEVSADIVENYNLLQDNRLKLAAEREKLLQHFQFSEEGIAIFSKDKKKIYTNSHFLQYLNIILDKPTLEIEHLFFDSAFKDIIDYINQESRQGNMFSKRINKSGKQFNLRIIIFEDESFELYISDITKSEKTRLLKQEMTNNIAHELRTPVTSIRGYLETILTLNINKDNERVQNFLERAYAQTIQLSELIQDISMLTKIEEAADRFNIESVNLKSLLEDLHSDISEKLNEKNDEFIIDVEDDVVINGNKTLLYSIFRNLAENSIAYAGNNIKIILRCYIDDNETYFFEFYDTGSGIEEKHLVRIFERFYRVNEGRTRDNGGSGLGLSIVKNAVLFHKGSILAKNRSEGGLCFLITFPKK
jgi:two-component system OmpR family sensor kinase/two-component system phosphate regulon sensor histidine kinase PhoR